MSAGEDFLHGMAVASAQRARALLEQSGGDEALLARALEQVAAPALTLRSGAFEIIAEIKLHSPAAGALAGPDEDLEARARRYARRVRSPCRCSLSPNASAAAWAI